MADEYNRELCKEKHVTIKEKFDKMETSINNIGNVVRKEVKEINIKMDNRNAGLHKKMNWFYLIAIATLVTVIVNMARPPKEKIIYRNTPITESLENGIR